MFGTSTLRRFLADRSAAISAMYALSLFGLITIAGVGWDYSRLMTMDSELQNAADQAALAAATQLTGTPGAIERAQDAANDFFANADSDWVNETKLANDGEGRAIVGLSFEFYESWNDEEDEPGPVATTDEDALYVRVIVDGREAFYALTAVGGVLSSGLIEADAVATLEGSACNVPPVMFCAPSGDASFPGEEDVGVAVDLREGSQNAADFTPGNFDLLDIDYTDIKGNDRNRSLGLNSDFLGCTGGSVTNAPGRRQGQTAAINTRFSVYRSNLRCDEENGDYCPADVTRGALVRVLELRGAAQNNTTCAGTESGNLVPYSDLRTDLGIPDERFPLDDCQADGILGCESFGDGVWDIDGYLNRVYKTNSASEPELDANGDGKITRYEVYNWERTNPDSTYRESQELARIRNRNSTTLYCSVPRPIGVEPVVPSDTQKDRRVLTTAVVDCTGNSGRFDVNTYRFVDLFLLAPAGGEQQGSISELRAEVIGLAKRADGGSGFQTFGRKKPVLVR